MDFKKKYIVKCVLALLAIDQEPAELTQSDKLEELLSSNSCSALLILYKPGKKLKLVYPEEDFPLDPNILMVTILKMQSDVQIANVHDGFNISLSTADCIRNMSNEISRVYLAASTENPGLHSLFKSLRSSQELTMDMDENELDSLPEEFAFWKKSLDRATSPDAKKKAEYFINCYKQIEEKWLNLDELDQKQFKQLIQVTFYNLENVWKGDYPYNSRRFAKLLKAFTDTLWRKMCIMVPRVSPEFKLNLTFVEITMKLWIHTFDEYRNLNWQNKHFPFTQKLSNYTDKVQEVKKVLTLLDEITVINEKINLQLDMKQIEQIFQDAVPLSLNQVLVRNWQKSKKKFDSILQSKSLLLALFFKQKVVSVSTAKSKPLKVLQNLTKWSSLLDLPQIRKTLSSQKSQIFKIMAKHVDEMKAQFQSRTGQSYEPIPGKEEMIRIKNFSPHLSAIAWSRQIHDKIKRIFNSCEILFRNEQNYQTFKYEVDEILKQIETFETDRLQKWKNQLSEAEYSDDGLGLQMNGKMMDLDMKNSILTVNYSEKLIMLIRDIRQLSELGLKKQIPKQIIEVADNGRRYYKQALSLKKIANFYNNMGQEIINSQRGMLLRELQNFQQSVENVNKTMGSNEQITWDNPASVQSYIKSLNEATNILVKQNNRLHKIHFQVIQIIEDLANYDLSKNRQTWLLKLEQIKASIETACKGKQAKYCRKWKVHCDVQLYKILEMQFLNGLEDIESIVPEINVDVILKNKEIMFKPSLEELKDKYYKQIMNYLLWPSRVFKGINGNLQIYQKIGERNSIAIRSLISKAEGLFGMLSLHLKSLDQWGVIPYLTVQGIHDKIQTMQQWQFSIRLIRHKRKQLEKVADYHKVQNFNINHTKFKNLADEYLINFVQQMMNALKESVIIESKQIGEFLSNSLIKLSKKPNTLEEMQQMKNTYLEIKSKQKETKRKIDEIIIKKKWILQATGYNHDTQKLEADWEEFSEKVLDYDNLLAEQIQHLKGLIDGRISQLNQQIAKFESKTSSILIPTNRQQIPELIQFLKDSKEEETKLVQKIKTLKSDCEQFELTIPNIAMKTIEWESWQILIEYINSLAKYEDEGFIKMKTEKFYEFQDSCTQWHEKVKKLQKTRQVVYIIKQIDLFKSIFTVYRTLSSGILERDHWRQLWTVTKIDKGNSENLKLGTMLNFARNILEKLSKVQDIISRAQGEATLIEALKQLAVWWETAEFQLTTYEGKRHKSQLIRQWKQMTSKVSDNMLLVSSLKESRWVGKFLQTIEGYETKIGKVERALYALQNIQRRWVYLEPILVGGALPDQLERFNKLDQSFRNIMGIIAEKPKISTLAEIQGLDNTLTTIQEEQQKCQKALNEFLEVKRSKFPRFYFLGDEDLLQILAQTQNPTVIQLHMKKLFAAIHSVGFTSDNKQIIQIASIEKERVPLTKRVQLSENVETWLNVLEQNMFTTLEQSLRDYIKSGTKQIKLTEYPSQILCVMEEIRFSTQLEDAIKGKNLKGLESQLKQDLQNLTKILPTVARLQALKLKAIILDLIHHLNVVSLLLKEQKPVTLNSYNYKKNFKFTPVPEMHLFDYKYKYTFQYQGNLPKLVHTPLTDKCYITLSLALSLGLGGNPYGPAGTGKTQTVKAMAMLFGRMCLVFNCDQGLDYKSMARIFLGLVRCGAWGCFDEFNRLLQEQLSAISQQIQVIQFAIKANQTHLQLIGKKVEVNPNSGIFVTLNPAGKGYGGRSRLPDNLKQLFRPVAMSVPDNELIAEVLLYAEGFKQAKQLAQKVICLFTLSRQLLSNQQHYDWGLRALKTILSVAGRLIFEHRSTTKEDISFEAQNELLIKAIRINTLSKLTFTDMRKFKFLLADIFPGIQSKDIIYENIQKNVKLVLEEMKLSYNEAQVSKILQFYQATQQRMGVVLVGPSGCGKTTIWKVLKRCYEKMSIPLKTYLMNPKSMPRQQLLGHMNNDTRQFNEGVLTVSAREVVKNSDNNWIILDGDIDPEWIQSLNSVLDDNHLLTLPTGQRINFPNGTCFIFETDSLVFASPATVSRMGMIFLNNEDINIQGVVQKWTETAPHLKDFFKTLDIQSLIGYDEHVQSTLIGQVNQVLSQMKGVTTQAQFIAACSRAFMANHLNDPIPLINKIFEKFSQRNPFSGKQIFSFYAEGRTFRTFSTLPQQYELDQILSDKGAVLQTSTIQSYLNTVRCWVENNNHFIVVGPEGCGKGMLIKQAFTEIRKTMKINFATIYCNSQTNAQHIIQKLYQICLKANSGAGKILRPKECARLVLYLKDINLPKPDKYQTIQLASFLQQIISHKGFYDPVSLQFVQLDEKIQIVVSMFPPSSIGRNQLTQRFTAIVKILNIDYPSNEDLTTIYMEYFRSLLRSRKIDESHCKAFANFFIEMYLVIKKNFSVDEYRHYSFTPKSLFLIFRNLPKYEFNTQEGLLQALCNELSKNYKNKVVSQQSKNKFDQLVLSTLRNHFKNNIKMDNIFTSVSSKLMKIKKQDYLSLLKNSLIQYEREYKEIIYVSTDQSLNYLSSIEKILVGDGHMMLVGCSGTGRRTSLILASLMQKLDVITLNTTRDFSARQFKKQLKTIIQNCVNQKKKQVLFLEDHNFGKPEFIEMINSLIVSGEVPGLFSPDELDRLPVAEQLRKDTLGKTLHEAFCERVSNNLKIVLSFDYQREGFFEMCASNPALYQCNIIWFDNLQSNSLRSIASEYLSKYLPEFSRATTDDITQVACETHKIMEEKFKAPQRHFYSLIETYIKIFKEKNQAKKTQGMHLQKGLEKLQEAKELVDVLSKQAFEKQKLLQVKNSEASKAMVEIQKAMTASGERKAEAQQLSRALQVQEHKILSKKQSVQSQLSEVQPLIEEAKKSVSGISSKNLNELASLPKPPQAIIDVMKVLVRMFGETNAQWSNIKTYLKNRSFIDNILNFDPRAITADIRRDVERQVERNQNSFQKEVIYRASVAAGPLAEWVKATLKYSRVVQTIKPLESQLNKLLKELQSSKKRVIECEQEIAVIDKKSKQLKKIYESKIGEAVVLDNQLKKSQETLTTAKNLLSKLEDEKVRWQADFSSIEKEVRQYPTSSFIAAAFTTYLSDKDENQRETVVSQWKSRTKMDSFNFLKFMITQSIQLKWRSLGLASDSLSVQNSVIIFASNRVPLLMDPNNQAIQWLKKNQEKMEVVNQRNPKFTNTLELAVRFGKELLIEQLEQIEPILVPIVRKDSFQQGSRVVMKVGDKVIDYSSTFKLYLATRNTNMELPANTLAVVSLINYSVTRSGLQSKLLSMVINHERPELEHKKSELLENEQKLKTSLSKLQEQLLEELGNSSGNILENKALLDNLTKTKIQSTNISQSLRESDQLNIKLDRERDIYRSLAKKGAQIYLLISQLYRVNNMYKFSLAYFSKLFLTCLNTDQNKISVEGKSGKSKLQAAESFLNKIIFNNIASSLFKIDRLSFGLFLLKGVTQDLISEKQWELFTGQFPPPLENKVILPTWASFERQEIFNTFCCALPKIAKSLNFNDSQFQKWYKSNEPQKQFPGVCSKLTSFQKILLVMVFRPQKLQPALIELVTQGLGVNSISGTSQSFKSMSQKQINKDVPALFIVSTGYDPSKELEEFCESQVGRENYLQLSMGGGQNEAALSLMRTAAQKGQWLCLKNIHLVTSWLPILEKQFRGIENKHDKFKLFLTSQQHLSFPNVLLETCFKVSYESPPGMKKNFARIYQQLEAAGSPLKASFVFLLAYFHSLVLQRRTYIPQGWSKSYEFSYSDLKVSMQIIGNLIKQFQQTNNLNLQLLYGIFEEGIYGGRIDNPSDLKVLRAYLRKYFNLLIINNQSQVALGLNIPKNQKQLTNFIAKLPDIDNPSLFGLPTNIDKVVQRNNALMTIGCLKRLTSIAVDGGQLKKQDWFKIVSPLLKSWQQIYKQIKDAKIPPIKQAQLLVENPVQSFVYLEMSQALELLEKINKSLKSMESVLQGKGLMTTQIQKLINKLITSSLPKEWEDFYSECEEPLDWIRKFGRRVILLKQWVIKANNQRLLEEEFDLSELFHPGVFLNACKQAAARNKIALDKLNLVATFEQDRASQRAVRLKGLLLQGCSMAKHLLGAPSQTDDQFEALPVMYIDFLSNPPPMYPNVEEFCLFSSTTRENILMKLTLGITGSSSEKIIAGTALMLKDI